MLRRLITRFARWLLPDEDQAAIEMAATMARLGELNVVALTALRAHTGMTMVSLEGRVEGMGVRLGFEGGSPVEAWAGVTEWLAKSEVLWQRVRDEGLEAVMASAPNAGPFAKLAEGPERSAG